MPRLGGSPSLQAQAHDTVEGANPTTLAHIWGDDDWNITNGETACVVGGRVGRVPECLLPQFDVKFLGVEFDVSEKVFPCTRNPCFVDDAARFERGRIVV